MTEIQRHILALCKKKEGTEIEFKGAKGGFPGSFWETYSAFCNTVGGIIVLGIKEKDKKFIPDGLSEEQIVEYKKIFWDTVNNRNKVSVSLLLESDVYDEEINGVKVLIFKIPRAPFSTKPVYLNGNPVGNTYRRNHEGDYKCSEEEVRRMFADSVVLEHPQDGRIYQHYPIDDLDLTSIQQYRQIFNGYRINHPGIEVDNRQFLGRIGAIATNPETGDSGVTLAGLLMFGKEQSIVSALPRYFVDYREKLSLDPQIRWTDRVYPDGYWQANLFQFYLKIVPKLYQALPVPFKMDGDKRVDWTPAHKAIREAVVNSLCHCHWGMMEGIVIERYPDHLYFSNPGTMLISVEEFFEGGHSISRNTTLQKMFVFLGVGEKAGSGADTIKKGWKTNGWPEPELKEHFGQYSDRIELTLFLGKSKKSSVKSSDKSSDKSSEKSSDKSSEKIIQAMKENPYVTIKELASELGISDRSIWKNISRLKESGILVRMGTKKSGYWQIIE